MIFILTTLSSIGSNSNHKAQFIHKAQIIFLLKIGKFHTMIYEIDVGEFYKAQNCIRLKNGPYTN